MCVHLTFHFFLFCFKTAIVLFFWFLRKIIHQIQSIIHWVNKLIKEIQQQQQLFRGTMLLKVKRLTSKVNGRLTD